jgi:hypothetical protein
MALSGSRLRCRASGGERRELPEGCQEEIGAWAKQGLTVVKIGVLLERRGIAVPYRTLATPHDCGAGSRRSAALAEAEHCKWPGAVR